MQTHCIALLVLLVFAMPAAAQDLHQVVDQHVAEVMDEVVEWRRDIHAHPELGNREFRTAEKVADHLRELGMEVRTEVGHTGVVGVLRGGQPGPVVALRADMDGLPVTEQVDVPFASTETAIYNGSEVGVMHACGHDNHVAILMGTASVLAAVRDDLPGTVLVVFQPAEEGAPEGEEGGADLMLKEGAFDDPKPDVVFGLHVGVKPAHVGTVMLRPGPTMASSDGLRIVVRGRQSHGAAPWAGVDPIVAASQIVLGLQTIASRQVDVTHVPSIITIGSIHGGVRGNIIPDEVELVGTVRAFDTAMQQDIHRRIKQTAEHIAMAAGATAEVSIGLGYPVTINDPDLYYQMLPTLERVAGAENVREVSVTTGAEDFSYFAQQVPGLYFFLGSAPEGADLETLPMNHSPHFFVDEGVLPLGVRSLAHLTIDYMRQH